jgi:hypothetical protein
MVDDEDYDTLSAYKWFALKRRNTFYAMRNIKVRVGVGGQTQLAMHQVILGGTSRKIQCDHIDGNGLNNCRSNLRFVTPRQNCQNKHIEKTSKYYGVDLKTGRGVWRARILVGDKRIYLGHFKTEEEAYAAYCNAVVAAGDTPL